MGNRVLLTAMTSCVSGVLASSAGHAETLAEAIALAYQTNPTLQSQRAQLRAIDETYVQARSQFGPTLQLQADGRYNQDQLRNPFSGNTPLPDTTNNTNLGSAQLSITQPLYTGGRATLETRAAGWRIRAGREALRITEGDIVFSVIQAYVDLRRDQQALAIRQTNLAAIAAQLTEITARWRAGEVTRTDVAQAEAQVAAEQANVATAENQLRASKIAYASVVGRNPGTLEPEPPLPNLPGSIEAAWAIAGDTSPEFQQALFVEQQSRTRLAEARTGFRPTISLRGSFGYSAELIPFGRRNFDRAIVGQLVLTQPLFTSGFNRSVVRQAADQNVADRLGIESARRSVIQSTTDSWNQMLTFRANIARQQRQVDAATIAFRGMRIEYRAGQRSTLDVLIAEEVLRDAELARLSAQHDAYLSEALVLRYAGRLDASDIVEALPRYDPAEHFRQIEHRGALPWEPLVRMLDKIRLAGPHQHAIPAPNPALKPVIAAPAANRDRQLSTSIVPTTPVPGTVSNVAPPPPAPPS